jgi:hypothetical protein
MSPELENLVKRGDLAKSRWPDEKVRLLRSRGRTRLKDAANTELSLDGRFDLAYNGAHALALAALHEAGYAPENRFIVFQVLIHTTALDPVKVRVLDKAHRERNAFEYQAEGAITERFVAEIIEAAKALAALLPDP